MTSDVIFQYYLLGNRPIRISCNSLEIPYRAEIIDEENGGFKQDLSLVPLITNSDDFIEINYLDFQNACLAKGVKPL